MGKRFLLAGALLVVTLATVGAAIGAENESGSAAAAPSADTHGPRPGPNFPTLESYYPAAAKRAGQEGIAVIHFCVDPNGRLTTPPTIATSSGNEALDAAALNLANAGSGLYLPGRIDGVIKTACSQFRIKFELRNDPAFRMVEDPRVPTISARLRALTTEYAQRMADTQKMIDLPGSLKITPGDPASVRTIRQVARALDGALDQSVAILADMLDDMEYLGKSSDIPQRERAIFSAEWPDERSGLARGLRQMIGASRDVVRSMDEMADYITFSTPRRSPDGTSPPPPPDTQIDEIRERARKAIHKLQDSINALSEAPPATGGGQ